MVDAVLLSCQTTGHIPPAPDHLQLTDCWFVWRETFSVVPAGLWWRETCWVAPAGLCGERRVGWCLLGWVERDVLGGVCWSVWRETCWVVSANCGEPPVTVCCSQGQVQTLTEFLSAGVIMILQYTAAESWLGHIPPLCTGDAPPTSMHQGSGCQVAFKGKFHSHQLRADPNNIATAVAALLPSWTSLFACPHYQASRRDANPDSPSLRAKLASGKGSGCTKTRCFRERGWGVVKGTEGLNAGWFKISLTRRTLILQPRGVKRSPISREESGVASGFVCTWRERCKLEAH